MIDKEKVIELIVAEIESAKEDNWSEWDSGYIGGLKQAISIILQQ